MLDRLLSFVAARRPEAPTHRPARLGLERLDDRLVPSVTANFQNGTLFLTSNSASDNVIVRQQSGRITVDGFRGYLNASQVSAVRIDGNGGNDWLDARSCTMPVYLYGGDGQDTLIGGHGNDTLDGGAHRDALYGQGGFDRIFASGAGETVSSGEVVRITVDQNYNQGNTTWCGPVSVARLLRAYGHNVTPTQVYNASIDSIDSWLIDKFGLGIKPGSLHSAMRRLAGGGSYEEQTSLGRVLGLLGSGKPVVALVRSGGQLHYITLTGFDSSQRLIYYTDTNGGRYQTSYQSFYDRWEWSFGLGDLGLRLVGVRSRTILY